MWDDTMQFLQILWREEKTLRTYPLSFFSDFDIPELDLFFLFAGFFMQGGLFRSADILAQKFGASRIFCPRSRFATYLSKMLEKFSLVRGATSRSLRKGATTFIHACRWLTGKDCDSRGGWQSESNSKNYITPLVHTTMLAGIFLAGWATLPGMVYAPRLFPTLTLVLTMVVWEQIVNSCFEPISLAIFQLGGRMRPFLHVCLASLIMHYPATHAKYSHLPNR